MKRLVSIFLAFSLIISIFAVVPSALVSTGTDASASDSFKSFNIDNPYEDVDWGNWKSYKTQLHCHTTASDGYLKVTDAVEYYYNLDYDAIAFTDHGTNGLGWDKEPEKVPIMRAIKKERTGGAYASIEPLSEEEYNSYLYGKHATYSYDEFLKSNVYSREEFGFTDRSEIDNCFVNKNSDGTFRRTNDGGMVDVLLGNELNMATPIADCHLTHYWCTYGQGLAGVYGDYETPSAESAKDGGVVMLAHVGEYVYTDKDTINHTNHRVDDYYVNKFARIFLDNPVYGKEKTGSVCGMGINSATDAHTRCDRFLYDQILQKTIPNGVVPWGFSFSDSHNFYSMNDAYTMMLIPDWSKYDNAKRNDMLRNCMEKGEFFSVSHYSNGYEMDGVREWPDSPFNEEGDGKDWPDEKILMMNSTPMVTNLIVDDETDTITVYAKNADRIVWVSNGNVIKRTENVIADKNGISKFEICLHEENLKNDVNLFIRFYITGKEGICYSQPLVLHELDSEGKEIPFESVDVPETHDVSTFLRALVTFLDWTIFKFNPIIWAFKYFALGYNPIERLIKDLDFFKLC